jgi:hypothetical protein
MWWSPNVDTSSAPIAPYWPGPDYVDIVGIDCYPKSLSDSSFESCYGSFYQTYSAAHNLPFAIGETGYGTSSQNAAWVSQLVSQDMCKYPNYIAASWFEYNKEENFLIIEGSSSILSQTQDLLLHNSKSGCSSGKFVDPHDEESMLTNTRQFQWNWLNNLGDQHRKHAYNSFHQDLDIRKSY